MGDTLLKGYLQIKCANPGRIVRKVCHLLLFLFQTIHCIDSDPCTHFDHHIHLCSLLSQTLIRRGGKDGSQWSSPRVTQMRWGKPFPVVHNQLLVVLDIPHITCENLRGVLGMVTITSMALDFDQPDFQVRSSSLLIRVYVSHHHENKGPPAFCIPLLDVHGLHRIQSRWGF